VEQAIAKDREGRHPTMAVFGRELRVTRKRFIAERGTSAPSGASIGNGERLRRQVWRVAAAQLAPRLRCRAHGGAQRSRGHRRFPTRQHDLRSVSARFAGRATPAGFVERAASATATIAVA